MAHPIPAPNAKERRVDPKTKQALPELQPINLQDFNVENLAGVEYYAIGSSAPAAFTRTTSACGLLLLWSRER
ncbi:MAG: hypothetical protein ABJE47_11230 [bacterium]